MNNLTQEVFKTDEMRTEMVRRIKEMGFEFLNSMRMGDEIVKNEIRYAFKWLGDLKPVSRGQGDYWYLTEKMADQYKEWADKGSIYYTICWPPIS